MDMENQLAEYIHLARSLYQTGPAHDFSHVERVFKLALKIGEPEKANWWILGIAALFHDIGREEEAQSGGQICHAVASAELTQKILTERGVEPALIKAVYDCIASHRYRDNNIPQSIEAKCLFDADKLDSLGAVGVARAYLWLGERGGTVYVGRDQWLKTDFSSNLPEDDSLQREWHIKLQWIKERMFTNTARQMAVKRSETMRIFLDTLEAEISGEE